MECKCSLNNNYEIIGLCDIKDFNEKIRRFSDESWSQITLPEKLIIPQDNPPIKSVLKVYLNIKIHSTKLVKSPSSDNKSIEGLMLLGNLLLVSGEIHQNIIYTSDTASNSIHSFKFELPFSSYIVLDENVDLEYDSFTVYPCVENLFLEQLDERTLNKSINLFLFAHKIEVPLTISNEFKFYQYSPIGSTEEIVKVSFDGIKKVLVASSSGILYNSERRDLFLKFELKDGTTKERKVIGTVPQNQNGTEFVRNLNNQEFKAGDLIAIAYQRSENTFLNNYPSIGQNTTMNFLGNRNFKITRNGIEPCLLPNVIVLKSVENEPVFNLGFDTELDVILVKIPKTVVTNPRYQGQVYFTITLKSSTSVQKDTASLQGKQEGVPVAIAFANQAFEYGDIIELTYKEGEKVEILDNPYPTASRLNLDGSNSKSFKITQSGLVQI